jgi:hypothetical protein
MKQKKNGKLALSKMTVANLGAEAANVKGGTLYIYSLPNTCRCLAINTSTLTISLQCPVFTNGTSIVINPVLQGF